MSSRNTILSACRSRGRASLRIASMLALLTFSACSKTLPVLDVQASTAQIDRPTQDRPPVPDPRPIDTSPVQFKVLTRETLPADPDFVYYALTPKQYEIMSKNIADMLRWVTEARWRLRYYRGEGGLDGTEPGRTGSSD